MTATKAKVITIPLTEHKILHILATRIHHWPEDWRSRDIQYQRVRDWRPITDWNPLYSQEDAWALEAALPAEKSLEYLGHLGSIMARRGTRVGAATLAQAFISANPRQICEALLATIGVKI